MSDSNYMSDPRAKTAEGFIAALNIFSKYWEKGMAETYIFGGQHDIIDIYGIDLEMLPEDSEDGKLLDALGFHAGNDGWSYFT